MRKKINYKLTATRRPRASTAAKMPPALSDPESDSDVPDQIPAKGKAKADPEPEVEDDDDEDEDEEEYRVEKILSHNFADDGSVLYEIKWLGYEDKADRTWEPVENLEGAQEILTAYHKKIGGPPEPKSTKKSSAKKGKRSASAANLDSPAPTSSTTKKRGRKSAADLANGSADNQRSLPQGSWEDHVENVHSIVEDIVEDKSGRAGATKEEYVGLLHWKDKGPKTQHKMKTLRQKCPQKLLDYYEKHLVFTAKPPPDTDENIKAVRDEDEDTKMGA